MRKAAWLLPFVLAPPLLAQVQMSELYYRLVPTVVTPHIPWAKPYFGEGLRLLVIAPRMTQRETLELAERLDADCQVVMTYIRGAIGTPGLRAWERAKGAYEHEVLAELRRALSEGGRYNAILIGLVPLGRLPLDVQYAILKRIADGCGLVVTHAQFGMGGYFERLYKSGEKDEEGLRFIATGVPFSALPVLSGHKPEEVVATRRLKRGRAVFLRYPGAVGYAHFLTPNPPPDGPYSDLFYEHYMALVIRALLWTARREPQVYFFDLPAEVRGDTASGANVKFTLLNTLEKPLDCQIVLHVRSPEPLFFVPQKPLTRQGVKEADYLTKPAWAERRKLALPPGRAEVDIRIPPLPAGRYLADVRVEDGSRKVNFASFPLTITSLLRIASLKVEPQTVDLQKSPNAAVEVSVELSFPAPEGCSLRLAVVDTYRRVGARATVRIPKGEKKAVARLPARAALSRVGKVRAELRVEGRTLDVKVAKFTVIRRKWDDFLMCTWATEGGVNEYVFRQALRVLREHGVDTLTNCPTTPEYAWAVAEEDFNTIPYMTRYFFQGDAPDRIRRPCLTDPNYRRSEKEKLLRNAKIFAPLDPLAYTLGDECFYSAWPVDLCWSKTCLAAYRRYLADQYGSIERLNEEWGTSYRSFDEVEPVTFKEAKERRLFPQWVDHKCFVDSVFADIMRFASDCIREVDKTARVGFDGPFNTVWFHGYDWWKLMRVFTMCNVYWHQPEQIEQVRSFVKPGMLLGMWYGGYMYGGFWGAQRREEEFQRWAPWYALMHRFGSVWWFASFGAGGNEVAISPSLVPYPCFAWHEEEVREIKSGLGKMLLSGRRLHNGIAIHYSQPSIHLAEVLTDFGDVIRAQRGAMWLLEDIGLQYDFLSSEQIEKGVLDEGEYRVLVLPLSMAISEKEAEAIERFVKRGGLVIADVRPGIADEHGKLWASEKMARLFGLRWERGLGEPESIEVPFGSLRYGGRTVKGPPVELPLDKAARPAGAKALSVKGLTILAENKVGKGAAVYLNFPFSAYINLRFDEKGNSLRDFLRAILEGHGIRPRTRIVKTEGGGFIPGLEAAEFSVGKGRVVVALKRPVEKGEEPVEVAVSLDKPAHVYDARRRKYLGFLQSWRTEIRPARAEVWSLLPYKVSGLSAWPRRLTVRRGETLTFAVRVLTKSGRPGLHVLHVEFVRPDRKPVQYLARNVLAASGRVEVAVPFALNEPVGNWRVTVRDVATGVAKEISLVVR